MKGSTRSSPAKGGQSYPDKGDQMQRAAIERSSTEQTQIRNIDIPIEIMTDRITPQQQGFTEYRKTSVALCSCYEQETRP